MAINKKMITTVSLLLTLVLSIQVLLLTSTVNTSTGYKHEKPIIIIDDGHNQTFRYTHMQSAIDFIEEEYDATIKINHGNFTFTNLRGADLIIIPSPYYETTLDDAFSDLEIQALTEFYSDRGSAIFLTNPYFFDEEMRDFSGHPKAMNQILVGDYRFLEFSEEDVILNDYHNLDNDERLLFLGNESFNNEHAIIQGPSNSSTVKNIVMHSTTINQLYPTHIVSTPANSYIINREGEIDQGSVRNHSLIACYRQTNKRGVSCGSGIMFSDLLLDASANTTWFESYDNKQLWENMVAWTLNQIPVPEPQSTIPSIGYFFAIGGAIFIVFIVFGLTLFIIGREVKEVEVSDKLIKMREKELQKQKEEEQAIQKAYYAEDVIEEDEAKVSDEDKDKKEAKKKDNDKSFDMKSISEEIKKKPKTRKRSKKRRKDNY
jgi:hypothetical protein